MCGITGIVTRNEDAYPVDEQLLARVCAVTRHRGPDETGTWADGGVGLGMNRLSIIDVAGGSQPIANEDGSARIVFNGEIYNHLDLRERLEKRGHRYRTNTDTESILHAYEEFGADCVKHLRGMFGFAIWDAVKQQLFLARDRLGIKPLHYLFDGERLIFGSEIKSILAYPRVERRMNASALVPYLAYGYVPDPDTLFAGIHKLPPGYTLTLRAGQIHTERYWDVEFREDGPHPEEYYVERLLGILDDAVRMRLMSEVPLGAFLSGGTDSSMVVALMAKHMGEPVKTFSIGFEEEEYSELSHARAVAEHFGTRHHEEVVRPDAEELIVDLVRQFDEPFADSSMIPTYYVAKTARKHVTVALSGDGGDELFGGYLRYVESPAVHRLRRMPRPFRDTLFGGLANALPDGARGVDFLRNLAGDADEQYLRHMTKGISSIHDKIMTPEFYESVETSDPRPVLLPYQKAVHSLDVLARRTYLDIKSYLPADILTKVDRTSMMVSLEARVPILDHEFVEFAATVPSSLKLKGVTTKYILKKAAERLMPKHMIYRPKKGFTLPVSVWIRGKWADMAHELLLGERALERRNVNPRYVRRIFEENQSGKRDNSTLIWTLMMLELWYREKIDEPARV